MHNLIFYLWLIILILYILSPLDLHPLFFDDIIALGVLLYLWFRNARQRTQRPHTYTDNQSQKEYKREEFSGEPSLEEAYRILEVNPDASWEEVKKAYKEKIARSHPDKVSHLSKELQEKAEELTLKLNKALDVIKRYKGF
jgi:DnaJ like chaperone protein